MHDLKAVLAAADRLERDLTETVEPCYDDTADTKLVAAFVRDLTDETPADEGWLAKVSPRLADGRCIFIWNAHLLEYDDDFDILSLRAPYTRGRVRLFALGMGLTLREDGR